MQEDNNCFKYGVEERKMAYLQRQRYYHNAPKCPTVYQLWDVIDKYAMHEKWDVIQRDKYNEIRYICQF